jgi:hypothetical protein
MIVGAEYVNPYKGMEFPQYTITANQIFQSVKAAIMYLHWNFSAVWTLPPLVPESWARRLMRYCCSQGSSQLAVWGESGRIQYSVAPTTTVTIPSRIKIHLHPPRPATPSMLTMAAARSPEKADAKEAAEKNTA